MSGGFDSYNYEDKIPQRLDLLSEAVKQIGADFVGLVDTFRWDEIFTEKEIKEMFGYKYSYVVKLDDERLKKLGHDNGISVLTNLPVKNFETVRIFNRNAIKTTIEYENRTIDIFSVYLDDLSEEVRKKEISCLLCEVNKNTPTIIMGDLNSLTKDFAKNNDQLEKFWVENPKVKEKLYSSINEMSRGEVIKLIESSSFIDSSEKKENMVSTKLSEAKFTGPFLRLDYAFHTPDLKVANFKVMRDNIFDKASDHYPICFEVE